MVAKKKPVNNQKNGETDAQKLIHALQQLNSRQEFSRLAYARALEQGGGHKVDAACGYPHEITFDDYKFLIDREGIARRANDLYSDECFSQKPYVYETESVEGQAQTPFEKTWVDLTQSYPVLNKLHRADVISGYGHYGILVIGVDDTDKLETEFPGYDVNGIYKGDYKTHNLMYLMPFNEQEATMGEKETRGHRFGKPKYYNTRILDPTVPGFNSSQSQKVHWTRCIHIADGCTSSDLIGVPRLKKVYNYIMNIRKVMGGSAEMFWMGGFPGTSFEVPPELIGSGELGEAERKELSKQIEDYNAGFSRTLVMSGLHANQLSPNISDPAAHIAIQMQAICIALEIPLRIFTGSEEARLASMNDSDAWNRRIHRRQDIHVTPYILRPTIQRFIEMGILPKPDKPVQVKWPDVYSVSEKDRAEIMSKRVRALGEYLSTGAFKLVPPLQFFTMWEDLTLDEASELVQACLKSMKSKQFGFLDELIQKQKDPAATEKSNKIKRRPAMGATKKVKVGTNEVIVNSTPTRCRRDGQKGFKCGPDGTCFTFTDGDVESKKAARKKASLEGATLELAKYLNGSLIKEKHDG